jgi:hypothetical protein
VLAQSTGGALADKNGGKLRKALKAEAMRKAARTDKNALSKIQKRTKGK